MNEFESRPAEPQIEMFIPERDMIATAKLYAEVFADSPWNEYTRCVGCMEFFGLQSRPGDCCGNCGKELVLAYPIDETRQYIEDESRRPDGSIFIMKKDEEIVGFAWGFSYPSIDDFVKEKYRTQQMQDKIKKMLEKSGVINAFFYFSECGIRMDQRGNGFSNLLSGFLFKEAGKTGLPIVLRTNCESPMVAVAQRFGMTQVMGPIVEIDRINKNILTKNGAVNDFVDSEIEERVLFVLK